MTPTSALANQKIQSGHQKNRGTRGPPIEITAEMLKFKRALFNDSMTTDEMYENWRQTSPIRIAELSKLDMLKPEFFKEWKMYDRPDAHRFVRISYNFSSFIRVLTIFES